MEVAHITIAKDNKHLINIIIEGGEGRHHSFFNASFKFSAEFVKKFRERMGVRK